MWHFQKGSVQRQIKSQCLIIRARGEPHRDEKRVRADKGKSNARVHNSTSLMSACVFRKRFASCRNDYKAFVPKWNCN